MVVVPDRPGGEPHERGDLPYSHAASRNPAVASRSSAESIVGRKTIRARLLTGVVRLRRDHRQVIDAITFEFRTGTQWVHLPEKYGNWRGVYYRLRMWALDGTWERVFTALVGPDRRRQGPAIGRSRSTPRSCVPTSMPPGAPSGEPADHAARRRGPIASWKPRGLFVD
ncbi:transposase [Streptomyces sp. BE147]|uniref:transposase n=1 Tax=Streptomyces sp. BE147 TaxID=3002524 RepID=UPI003FA79C98